jgi:hypothetical protein
MHETPSTEFGSSKHGPCKLFGCQPLTFKAESRMSRAKKKLFSTILKVPSMNLGSS